MQIQEKNIVVLILLQDLEKFGTAGNGAETKMIRVYGKVPSRILDVLQLAFCVQHSQRICSAVRIGAVMIEGALERSWQAIQIVLTFDDVIVSAGFQRFNRSLFVAHSGDYDHRQRQTVFTDVFQERQAVAIAQVHVSEYEIKRF